MSNQPSASVFRTTSWTLILRAPDNPTDFCALLELYRDPIYVYLKRKLNDPHRADDLTQEFIRKAVIEKGVLSKADPSRGRFRFFLMTLLDRFVIDEHRREAGRNNKRPKTMTAGDDLQELQAKRSDIDDPAAEYNREYFRTLLSRLHERLEAQCRSSGMDKHWTAYESHVLRPILYGCEAISIEELAGQLGASAPEVSHWIGAIKRKLAKLLRDVVAETIENPDDLDDEIAELWRWWPGS